MTKIRNIGKCISCGKLLDSNCDTNYNKTIFICNHCHYPNLIKKERI